MWEPQPPGILWDSIDVYRDCFTFTFIYIKRITLLFLIKNHIVSSKLLQAACHILHTLTIVTTCHRDGAKAPDANSLCYLTAPCNDRGL